MSWRGDEFEPGTSLPTVAGNFPKGERVSVSIAIGGTLSEDLVDELIRLVQAEHLSTEWGGRPFDPDQLPESAPLRLYAHEVLHGELGEIEDFCCSNGLPFVRWSGGAPGAFGPEIIVYTGDGPRQSFAADEDENIVLNGSDARELGSFEAISQHFADGEYEPPPFKVAPSNG